MTEAQEATKFAGDPSNAFLQSNQEKQQNLLKQLNQAFDLGSDRINHRNRKGSDFNVIEGKQAYLSASNDRRNIVGQAARTNINWIDDSPDRFRTSGVFGGQRHFATTKNSITQESPDADTAEAALIAKQIKRKMEKDAITVGNLRQSPYASKGPTFEELKNAKASEFLKDLALSSYKLSYQNTKEQPRADAKFLNTTDVKRYDKQLAQEKDRLSKLHLTQMMTLNSDANGNVGLNASFDRADSRFNTVNAAYFNQKRFGSENRANAHEIKSLHKFLKSTSIKHGNTDFEASSTAKDSFTPLKLSVVAPGRYNQEEQTGMTNANKVGSIPLGPNSPTLKAQAEASPERESPNKQFSEISAFKSEISKYGTNNHFELGLDPNGGINAGQTPRVVPASDRHGNSFERDLFKEKGNKQHFSIQPIKP